MCTDWAGSRHSSVRSLWLLFTINTLLIHSFHAYASITSIARMAGQEALPDAESNVNKWANLLVFLSGRR